MRALWSGALNFGLVNIPVKLYSASMERGIDLDFLHKKDLEPIRYARVCRREGKEVPYEDIVRGYEYEKGDYIVLTEQDFKRANAKKTRMIEIEDFTDEDQIDSIYYEKPYYLEPEKGAEKPYVLLREALKRSKKVGIARFVLRNKEHVAVLKPEGKAIVLVQLRFESEIRKPAGLALPDAHVEGKQIAMALRLIDELTAPFTPSSYKDEYTEELKEVIEEKIEGKEPKERKEELEPNAKTHDIMALLRSSLERLARGRQPLEKGPRAKRKGVRKAEKKSGKGHRVRA